GAGVGCRSGGGARLAGEAEDPFAEDVPKDLGGAAHDRVAGGVADAPGGARRQLGGQLALPQRGRRTEQARAERRDALLELGAEGIRRGREAWWRLTEDLPQDQEAPDAVPRLDRLDL